MVWRSMKEDTGLCSRLDDNTDIPVILLNFEELSCLSSSLDCFSRTSDNMRRPFGALGVSSSVTVAVLNKALCKSFQEAPQVFNSEELRTILSFYWCRWQDQMLDDDGWLLVPGDVRPGACDVLAARLAIGRILVKLRIIWI